MKSLLSIRYSAASFNLAMLILRIGIGGLLLPHGYDKLIHFNQYRLTFMNFLGMGSTTSLALIIFAEFFCSVFIIAGLFTRLMVIPPLIGMFVVVFKAHNGDIFGDGEHGALFAIGCLVLLFVGPGKASLDGVLRK